MKCFSAGLLLSLSIFSLNLRAGENLVPPSGYLKAIPTHKAKSFSCPGIPKPFTEKLDFPSKYEGSGKSRDTFNPESDERYKKLTKPVNEMEKGVNKLVKKFVESGNPEILNCTLEWYKTWAEAKALENTAENHTGRSVRKWALASLSGAYLKLKFSSSAPLKGHEAATQIIEAWLGRLADHVVPEWKLDDKKVNNHHYWAAWSVMATGVALNRQDLFDWSLKVYKHFAAQVDSEGYLQNEMDRKTRALGYHNYALTPVAMMAAFGKANHIDLAGENKNALTRLAGAVMSGLAKPEIFKNKTGAAQELKDFEKESSFAWLEPYCWTVTCDEAQKKKLESVRPVGTERLGGDLTSVFKN